MNNPPTAEELRIAQINSLDGKGEFKRIRYKNEELLLPVVEVPLELLVYNAHNGRIKSLTLSYEAQNSSLDPLDPDDKLKIEQFLYDSAKGRNDKTIESIEKIGQQEFGIITKDGVIIDGNRRAMLLNKLNRKIVGEKRKFKTVILPDNLKDNPAAIIALETSYQMGVDSKVDYNPIEKYIRCKELYVIYSIEDIADKMAESVAKIKEWLEILDLMEEYLEDLGTPLTYTRLEKREGHFVDLIKYLRAFRNKNSHQSLDWQYRPADVEELKKAYFTYIRLGIPVARARVIARPANGNSFFSNKDIWSDFITEHHKALEGIVELSVDDLSAQYRLESMTKIIDTVDEDWKTKVKDNLDNNLYYFEGLLADKQNSFAPKRLLKRAKSTLFQIDRDVLRTEMDDDTSALIEDIDEVVQKLKLLY